MEVRPVIRHRGFHQPASFDVFTIRAFPSGDMHPMIERSWMPVYLRSHYTKPRIAKNPIEVASSKGARVRMIACVFDSMVQLSNFRVFRHHNVEHAHTASGFHDARHFPQHLRRI